VYVGWLFLVFRVGEIDINHRRNKMAQTVGFFKDFTKTGGYNGKI